MTRPARVGGTRLAHLDRLKTMLVAVIIVAHGLLGYCAIDDVWPYQPVREVGLGPINEAAVELAVLPGVLFAMGLFFLVSGLLTPGPLERKGTARFVRDRLLRLGVPLVVWVLVLWPSLMFAMRQLAGDRIGWWELFMAGKVDTGPMWFVEVLLLFSLGYAAWWHLRSGRRPPARPVDGRWLVALAAGIAAGSFLVRLWLPFQSQQWAHLNEWGWPQYLALFALGVAAARRGGLQPVPDRLRRGAGFATVLGGVGVAVLYGAAVAVELPPEVFASGLRWTSFMFCLLEGVLAVGASVWLLALAQRHLDRPLGPTARALSRAAYAAFIVQGPVLIGLALALRPLGLPGDVKAVLVAGLGLAGSFAVARLLVTRTPLRRIL